ncbi:MAG: 1-acyl-sn-glycerol-3-phosphate acyltransferase [Ferruginibacter sp.]
MLYSILKIYARLAIKIYCRDVRIKNKALLNTKGPLLISMNHPNSFLDAVIIATVFKYPVFSLARGDVFGSKLVSIALKALNIMPVYRITEGAANIEHNFKTFDACKEIFKKNGTVLIFCEGYCVNEWHLRPLKKGPARLLIQAWENNIPLKAMPVGINYDAFASFGKNVQLNIGEPLSKENTALADTHGKNISRIKENLTAAMQELVLEIKEDDIETRRALFNTKLPLVKKILLCIPALAGFILHFPLFFLVKKIVKKSNIHNAHFDSMMVGCLMVTYPVYLLLFAIIAYLALGGWLWMSVFVLLPFFAWSCVQLKPQV